MDDNQGPADVDFSYIDTEKGRTIVEQFYREAAQAFRGKLYIAAVVLSGGLLEAILAFALMARQSEAHQKYRERYGKKAEERPSPRDWYLPELIDIASSMNLIGKNAKDAAWAAKDFRNLIHAYNLMERSPPRWRALAKAALAAIEEISPSLAGRLGNVGTQP